MDLGDTSNKSEHAAEVDSVVNGLLVSATFAACSVFDASFVNHLSSNSEICTLTTFCVLRNYSHFRATVPVVALNPVLVWSSNFISYARHTTSCLSPSAGMTGYFPMSQTGSQLVAFLAAPPCSSIYPVNSPRSNCPCRSFVRLRCYTQ